MNKSSIIIVDDDDDDLQIIVEAFKELKVENEIIVFNNGFKFLEYMWTTENPTFFILCDINLGVINGLELKKKVQEDTRLRLKCIPFILYSTSKASKTVLEAYSFGVQGYFVKPNSLKGYTEIIQAMIVYWAIPNTPIHNSDITIKETLYFIVGLQTCSVTFSSQSESQNLIRPLAFYHYYCFCHASRIAYLKLS